MTTRRVQEERKARGTSKRIKFLYEQQFAPRSPFRHSKRRIKNNDDDEMKDDDRETLI